MPRLSRSAGKAGRAQDQRLFAFFHDVSLAIYGMTAAWLATLDAVGMVNRYDG